MLEAGLHILLVCLLLLVVSLDCIVFMCNHYWFNHAKDVRLPGEYLHRAYYIMFVICCTS